MKDKGTLAVFKSAREPGAMEIEAGTARVVVDPMCSRRMQAGGTPPMKTKRDRTGKTALTPRPPKPWSPADFMRPEKAVAAAVKRKLKIKIKLP
jgi:hypothetical protein